MATDRTGPRLTLERLTLENTKPKRSSSINHQVQPTVKQKVQPIREAEKESEERTVYGAQVVLGPLEAERARHNNRFAIDNELRIALVGKTGVGKSSTANTICGGDYFECSFDATGVTNACQQKRVNTHGKSVLVIDTPGIFDTETEADDIEREIKRCIHIGAPGLHAIIFVMEIGRFRDDDITAINTFLKYFEKEMKDRVIILFTYGDKLLKKKKNLDSFLETAPSQMKTFIENCGNRTILFNNEFSEDESYSQVESLLNMIESLKVSNALAFYSDALFKKAEERIQKREEEIEKKLKEKYRLIQEEFKRTYRSEIERQIQKEREDEIKRLKAKYEKKLENVREKVRKEIATNDTKCTVL